MENQYKKIKGYRDLSQQEINLMNKIKQHAEDTGKLLDEVFALRFDQDNDFITDNPNPDNITYDQVQESFRVLSIAKENLQQGYMWAVRSVALPETF